MTPKTTAEQREALRRRERQSPVRVEDDETHEAYFLVDMETIERLRHQQDSDAIRDGLADVEAGRVSPLDEAFERIRAKLGLPPE
ncbi:MAG TPA: hypothetical protein VHZ24_00945 [Pirellulales bacterium]|jgi:predicted transcriptional regulator|nr:hypothetical protein [Pirellulales bacterium]